MKLKELLITILPITTSLSVNTGWFFSDVDNDLKELEELHKLVLPDSIKITSWLTKKINRIFKKKPLPVWLQQS